ncbi:hypothetical protein Ddc_10998 [Ditylenchus destructor]|nr:hypothetical protein Ddc_10998 [Ditylenchus destructor]
MCTIHHSSYERAREDERMQRYEGRFARDPHSTKPQCAHCGGEGLPNGHPFSPLPVILVSSLKSEIAQKILCNQRALGAQGVYSLGYYGKIPNKAWIL